MRAGCLLLLALLLLGGCVAQQRIDPEAVEGKCLPLLAGHTLCALREKPDPVKADVQRYLDELMRRLEHPRPAVPVAPVVVPGHTG